MILNEFLIFPLFNKLFRSQTKKLLNFLCTILNDNLICLKEKQLAKAKDFGKPKFIW